MAARPVPAPEVPASELPVTAPEVDTSYDDAFAAAVADDAVVSAPPAETPPAPAETPPAPAEGSPVEEAPAETPPVPAEGAPAETPPAPAETPAAAGPTAEEIVSRLADVLDKQPAPAQATPAAPATVPIYSPEEQTVLDEYEKNWPDVARAESLRRRVEYTDMMKFMFTEVENYVRPVFDQLKTMGNTLHVGELKAAVPDYSDSLEADVVKWIDTQPGYLQIGMKQVMQTGTSDEVADLIGRYRGAVAPTLAPAAPAPTPVSVKPTPSKTELSSAAIQAADSLAPVSSDRTRVPVGEDPQDFNAAFARYAAER